MARGLTITYGSFTIGGSSVYEPEGGFEEKVAPRECEVSGTFLAPAASAAAQATQVAAIKAAFELPRQKLEVKVGSTVFSTYDPSSGVLTGYEPEPEISLDPSQPPASVYAVRFRWRVRYKLPATAINGQAGRDDKAATYRVARSLQERRLVVFAGVWTAIPGTGATAQFAAAFGAYSDAKLDLVDAVAEWTEISREVTPNDSDTEVTYTVTFWETVNGRRDARIRLSTAPNLRKTITISGTYVKVGSSSAKTLYEANEDTHSNAAIAALGGTYDEPTVEFDYNDQDESLSFTRVYVELIHQQSAGSVNDADISEDKLTLGAVSEAPGDSPFVGAGRATTVSAGAFTVQRMTLITASYSCKIKKGVDAIAKWDGGLKAHVIAQISQRLRLVAVALDRHERSVDPTDNVLTASLALKAMSSDIVQLEITETTAEDPGTIFTELLDGEAHSYLEQPGKGRKTKTRTVSALVRSSSSLQRFFLGTHDRWRPVAPGRSFSVTPRVIGLGPSVGLVVAQFSESFLWVAKSITGPARGSGGSTVERAGTGSDGGGQSPGLAGGGGGGAGGGGSPADGSGGGSSPSGGARGGGQSSGSFAGADTSEFSFGFGSPPDVSALGGFGSFGVQ